MRRTPLPNNYLLRMENNGEYIIKKMIAEGGFSLIYEAETAGGTTPVVIKEYYPEEGAFRNEQNKVCPLANYEERFVRNLTHFNNEGEAGGQIAMRSFQTVSFLSCGNGYALMQKESKDMISIADLVERWSENPPIPYTANPKDLDPVFTDLVRLKYSLRIIESVLSVLSMIHNSGYLHLDISSRNVIWAGLDQESGRNCAAFIADYGCSIPISEDLEQIECQMSYSPGFAAPEVQRGRGKISPATDLYSVGMLLFFLCVGDNALEISRNRKHQVERETAQLKLPQRFKDSLSKIICTAITGVDSRYQTANEMIENIRSLEQMIPLYPVNPDSTNSFTLYSLKSMLEGSLETHYSWAHELCDRRNVGLPEFEESILQPLTWTKWTDDLQFLQWVLPDELYSFLKQKIDSSSDKQGLLLSIMTGKYSNVWKHELRRIIARYGLRDLFVASRTVLNNSNGFFENQKLLFQIIGKEGQRLQNCYYQVADKIRHSPYIGLAMFTIYALLGSDGFANIVPSPSKAGSLFYPL